MKPRSRVLIAAIACILLPNATSRASIQYTVTDLGTLNGVSSSATSINNLNEVVGTSGSQGFFYAAPGPMHAISGPSPVAVNNADQVVDDDVFYQSPDSPGQPMFVTSGVDVATTALNNLGHATGFTFFQTGGITFNHAFLYHDGIVQDLSTLDPSANAVGFGLNDADEVVGRSAILVGGAFSQRATLWTPADGIENIGTLGGSISVARSINNAGVIVGASNVVANGPDHVFLTSVQSHGLLQDLGTIEGTSTIPLSLSNEGFFVGNSGIGAFIGNVSGSLENLNDLIDPTSGWSLTSANSINDSGYIVGTGINPAGQQHAFLLTPLPDPAALPLLLIPATLLLRRSRDAFGRHV